MVEKYLIDHLQTRDLLSYNSLTSKFFYVCLYFDFVLNFDFLFRHCALEVQLLSILF